MPPSTEAPFSPDTAPGDAQIPRGASGELVLIVEDDDSLRPQSAATLRELGYSVIAASDGAQALLLIDQQPNISLMFTDIVLPGGMNGRQLAQEAMRRRPNLKILFTSGYPRDAIVRNGQLEEGMEFMAKPFRYAELAKKVRSVLRG